MQTLKLRFKIALRMAMGTKNAIYPGTNYVDLINLIRSIQRAEGNIDCYRRGQKRYARVDCAWREHCLMGLGKQSTDHIEAQGKRGNYAKYSNPVRAI